MENTIEQNKKKVEEFELLARPLIKYLCENHHPHVTIIITPTDAQLLYGQMSTGNIDDYILDQTRAAGFVFKS